MILLSAGHYPLRPGANYKSFCEHDEAVRWVESIGRYLESEYGVVPTGKLRQKVAFINRRDPICAIEVHFNSAIKLQDIDGDGIKDIVNVGNGALSLYCPGSIKGKQLASLMQSAMETIFKRHWDGVMEGYYRMDKRNGVDFFLRRTSCPAVIIEPEFIHHKDLIQSNREEVCRLLAEALDNFALFREE